MENSFKKTIMVKGEGGILKLKLKINKMFD